MPYHKYNMVKSNSLKTYVIVNEFPIFSESISCNFFELIKLPGRDFTRRGGCELRGHPLSRPNNGRLRCSSLRLRRRYPDCTPSAPLHEPPHSGESLPGICVFNFKRSNYCASFASIQYWKSHLNCVKTDAVVLRFTSKRANFKPKCETAG